MLQGDGVELDFLHQVIVSDIDYRECSGEQEVSARVSPTTSQKGDFRIWFRAPADQGRLTVSGDPFLAGLLIPCMYAGEDLQVEGPVSESLLRNVPTIQSLITAWYPGFHRISVTCEETYRDLPEVERGFGQGCCFSAGVDSWYSLLKHEDTITHLVMARGFDVKPEADGDYWNLVRRNVERIAERMGKQLLVITTNLRAQTDFQLLYNGRWGSQCVRWGKRYSGPFYNECSHGSSLAAFGLLLRGSVSNLVVPSSWSYRELVPWGSHPLLDPLFSSEDLALVHDGCEANRLQKIENRVSQSSLALESLRVCWKGSGPINCGRCEKCLRTMMELRAIGCLPGATSFPPLDLEQARRRIIKGRIVSFYQEMGSLARERGDRELARTCAILVGDRISWYRLSRLLGRKALGGFETLRSVFKGTTSPRK